MIAKTPTITAAAMNRNDDIELSLIEAGAAWGGCVGIGVGIASCDVPNP